MSGTSVFVNGGQSDGDTAPTQTFHFDPLPDGTELKAVHCTVTDHVGEPQAVPFRVEGIRLP